ncbi:MAG TPA: nucleotidyltransferase domain-containing protein [Limnobacter sp.]|uniref:nucleotidyltransferase domain-containing protein n=1 Tax=Limnobacter sp. TaxID=2003368 RepID=UPI002ED7AC72
MKFNGLSAQEERVLIDLRQAYQAYQDHMQAEARFRGSMGWKTVSGAEYLVRHLDGRGSQKSLGRRSEETERILATFVHGKAEFLERKGTLQRNLTMLSAMARSIGLGRVPHVVGKLLRALQAQGVLGAQVLIAGTHALYAYEAAAAVRLDGEMLATADVDILIDARQRLKLINLRQDGTAEPGLMDLLLSVDSTFRRMNNVPFRAVNQHGFMVDFIKSALPLNRASDALGVLDPTDLQPVEVHKLDWLLSSPKFEATVIDSAGKPAPMVVPDPRAFALHKKWLSEQPDREPEKRARDAMQARAVVELLVNRLQHLPLSKAALQQFPEVLVDNSDLDWSL